MLYTFAKVEDSLNVLKSLVYNCFKNWYQPEQRYHILTHNELLWTK